MFQERDALSMSIDVEDLQRLYLNLMTPSGDTYAVCLIAFRSLSVITNLQGVQHFGTEGGKYTVSTEVKDATLTLMS